ncbi:MAG: hypothetical protein WDN46_20350 [Methylocella sp.]
MSLDEAGVSCGSDERCAWIAITGVHEYAVRRSGRTYVNLVMTVVSLAQMNLMYLRRANFTFVEGGWP